MTCGSGFGPRGPASQDTHTCHSTSVHFPPAFLNKKLMAPAGQLRRTGDAGPDENASINLLVHRRRRSLGSTRRDVTDAEERQRPPTPCTAKCFSALGVFHKGARTK